jgi:hypothetical protein
MALDRDGTAWLEIRDTGQVIDINATGVSNMSNESGSNYAPADLGVSGYLALIFPEKRDVDAIFIAGQYGLATIQYSLNSTNGVDGTWTVIPGPYTMGNDETVWRTGTMAETVLAVKALRFYLNGSSPWQWNVKSLHVWGEIAPGENPDRMVFWNAGSDTKMDPATLDWGDVPRSSSADKIVRVKNVSSTKTAVNARVSFDILTDGSPSVPAQHLVSYGGSAFLSQVNLGSLAPGAISGPITLRRVTPSNAQYGLFAPRVSAVADSWT